MKKENVTISFESGQLAALEFSLKRKNTSVQAQLEELLKCLYESGCRSRCGSIWTAARLAAPAVRQGRQAADPRRSLPRVGADPLKRNGEVRWQIM